MLARPPITFTSISPTSSSSSSTNPRYFKSTKSKSKPTTAVTITISLLLFLSFSCFPAGYSNSSSVGLTGDGTDGLDGGFEGRSDVRSGLGLGLGLDLGESVFRRGAALVPSSSTSSTRSSTTTTTTTTTPTTLPIRPIYEPSKQIKRSNEDGVNGGDEQDIAELSKRRRVREGEGKRAGVVGGRGEMDVVTHTQTQRVDPVPSTMTSSTSTSTSTSSSSSTLQAPNGPVLIPPTTTDSPDAPSEPFPTPFDNTLSYSLEDGCVAFLTRFLTSDEMQGRQSGEVVEGQGVGGVDEEARRCRPFGMLVGSSAGWAGLIRQPDQLNAALSQICHPVSMEGSTGCSTYFDKMKQEMDRPETCRSDLRRGNTVALSAYRGFQYYDLMQAAACLVDDQTGAYCYLEAMSDKRPDDAYLWMLPAGNTLPSTTTPTCSACSRSLLELYASVPVETSSTDIPASSYGPGLVETTRNSTAVISATCGSGFVDIKVASASTTSSAERRWCEVGMGSLGVVVGLVLAVMTMMASTS